MKLFTHLIEEKNFHNAYAKAIQAVLKQGTDLVIGGAEQKKPIKDSCMLISLTGNAIKQIENKELHPQFPTKKAHLDKYCEEYTRDFLEDYGKRKPTDRFSYLYFERLCKYNHLGHFSIDQLRTMAVGLYRQVKSGITSNRMQAITWYVESDNETSSPPCLQRIQIRYIPENKVDIHLTWRSRDLYAAWQSNVICLIDMLNREVVKPNNWQIERIIDFSDSLHIYKTDLEEAKKVKLVPTNPQEI